MSSLIQQLNLFLLQKTVWMLTKPVNVANYDFRFEQFFECQHPYQLPSHLTATARIGAMPNYSEFYETLEQDGISLVHTPEQHLLCSELPNWYPLLQDITPRSIWFDDVPTLTNITQSFEWPIFF